MKELDDEQMGVIAKVQRLLNTTGRTEEEAASYTAKAMDLLNAYNLDMTLVERHSGKTGKREDTKLAGGLYPWQRRLWESCADLNFCMYWAHGGHKGGKYEHRVLGRHENVVATQVLATYLQQTIERLARERVGNKGAEFFTRANISYREGMAERLAMKLAILREDRMEADRKNKPRRPRDLDTPAIRRRTQWF